jgi:hypothetical protein
MPSTVANNSSLTAFSDGEPLELTNFLLRDTGGGAQLQFVEKQPGTSAEKAAIERDPFGDEENTEVKYRVMSWW